MAGRLRHATVAGLLALIASTAATAQSATPAAEGRLARPSIAIVTPEAGSTIHERSITVSVSVRRFKVVDKQFGRPVAREGHVHFYLDVKTLPRTHTYPSPVPYRSVSETSYTWTGVSPGRHIVAVQLVGNDHVPLRPPATDRVVITVD